MKKLLVILALTLTGTFGMALSQAAAYNYGDYKSSTLTTKAWGALSQGDLQAVLAYTNKNLELFSDQAKKMEESLTDYPTGDNKEIFGYWALNDLGTSLYIQGEAYRQANMMEEAKEAYQKVIDDYTYAQAWDTKGWFWKPAAAAKEKLEMMASGTDINFGDYTSSYLTGEAWKSLNNGEYDKAQKYVDKVVELYGDKAKEMQNSLTEFPWESKEVIFSYWALNDVGAALFVKGKALNEAGNTDQAKAAFRTLVDDYFYSQCWDPAGWFWKPAEAAQQELDKLESI